MALMACNESVIQFIERIELLNDIDVLRLFDCVYIYTAYSFTLLVAFFPLFFTVVLYSAQSTFSSFVYHFLMTSSYQNRESVYFFPTLSLSLAHSPSSCSIRFFQILKRKLKSNPAIKFYFQFFFSHFDLENPLDVFLKS